VAALRQVLSIEKRPNCLIIDEIDGAPSAAITQLLKIIKAEGGGKGKKGLPSLKRPIICICNDIQAPALRPLREIALQIPFEPIEMMSLVTRLEYICNRKQIAVDRAALSSLAEGTDGDIRSCLSTLQFASLKTGRVTLSKLQDLGVGQKDKIVDAKAVWQEIFQLPRTRRPSHRDAREGKGDGQSAKARRLHQLYRNVQANGEYQKMVNGMFENFLFVKGSSGYDPEFKKVCTTPP